MTTIPRKIQIKRSVDNDVIPPLSAGELAYTQVGNNFFIGAPDGTSGNIRIGHKLHDGVLTANEALVANSTLGIDRVYVANLDVSIINANGSPGDVSYVLTSGGYNDNVYWAPLTAPFYTNTHMNDFTGYGLGWMNIAPNQDPDTLGFRFDVFVPHGAIFMLAQNPGTDPAPITIYSPSTTLTPMMWVSPDNSGPYDPVLNPQGQDYWFNITPPPQTIGG
jgi:hypothetical protein